MTLSKKTKRLCASLLALSFLAFYPISVYANTYTITEEQLTTLESDLATLKANNETLQNLLNESNQDLEVALSKLGLSEKDLVMLKAQLSESQDKITKLETQLSQLKDESAKAKASSKAAEASLAEAQGLLNKYEKEVKAEINSLKMQRTALIGCVVAALLVKH